MPKKKVLIVEDKPENIEAAKEYFKSQNVEATYVKSTGDAKKALETKDYDFALIDWELPEGKVGFDILKEAKKKAVPAAVFSEGEFYHGGLMRKSELFFDEKDMEEIKPARYKLGSKDQESVWSDAYEKLQEATGKAEVEELAEAKKRFKKFRGKRYEKR